MKKLIVLLLTLGCMFSLVGCDNKLIEGTEKIYSGTLADYAMSVVNEGDRYSRRYITISADNERICFWLRRDCENPAQIGDNVIVESAIEEYTNLLVAISITVE